MVLRPVEASEAAALNSVTAVMDLDFWIDTVSIFSHNILLWLYSIDMYLVCFVNENWK